MTDKPHKPNREDRLHSIAQGNLNEFYEGAEKATKGKTQNKRKSPKHYDPTKFERHIVRKMVSFGVPQCEIASCLGISAGLLTKHFKYELSVGSTMRNIRVAETAYAMAVSGQSFSATAFWLKCRAGWRETDKALGDGAGVGGTIKEQAAALRQALDDMDDMEEGEHTQH